MAGERSHPTLDGDYSWRLVEELIVLAGQEVVHAHQREAITRDEEDPRARVLLAHDAHLVTHILIPVGEEGGGGGGRGCQG